MKKIEAIIFDMDGTLYSFDENSESHFTTSAFGLQIFANCVRFFEERFSLDRAEAESLFTDISTRYNGEVSLGVEREHGIDRSQYFAFTWNLQVKDFVKKSEELVQALQQLSVQTGVLTSAPLVWTERVLDFLQVREHFGPAVFTGDGDIRKPNPLAFQQLVDFWNLDPAHILSVGDQEKTDILPAKALGMQTLRIAKNTVSQADLVAPDVTSALALLKEQGVL